MVREEYEYNMNRTWLLIEVDHVYKVDYQMKMLSANRIPGFLPVQGQGKDEKSQYRYEISEKESMKTYGEKEGWSYKRIEEFMWQLIKVMKEMEKYLLNAESLILRPDQIFHKEGEYYFCYCPDIKRNIWEEFHTLTEYFVKEADYQDKEAIYLTYSLHRASMETNFSLENTLEKILEQKEQKLEEVEQVKSIDKDEVEENVLLEDWAEEVNYNKASVIKERQTVWEFVRNRFPAKNKNLVKDDSFPYNKSR